MSETRQPMRSLLALIASALCAVACGGSATENTTTQTDGGGGTSGAGGGGASAGAGDRCEQATEGYVTLLTSLLSQSANQACTVNADCGYISTAACGHSCSVSTASTTGGALITAQLAAYAATSCASCTFPNVSCPELLLPAAACIAGQCSH